MGKAAVATVPRETNGHEQLTLEQKYELVDLELIDIGPNVRVNVEAIDELAASVAEHGILQPIKVRPDSAGERWLVVWGQRRVLAARQAGLTQIPALIDAGWDDKSLEQLSIEQLVENLHRADLNPMDRARAMRVVVKAGMSQAALARTLGIAPSTVANDVGLLEAPAKIQTLVEQGTLTPSHAKAMKGLAPSTQRELATEAVRYGMSAHRLEEEVQRRKQRAEREAEQERKDAEEGRQALERLRQSIADLAAAKKPGLDVELVVFNEHDYSSRDGAAAKELAASLTAAGFTKVRLARSYGEAAARPSGGVCDCTAWKATLHSVYSNQSGGYTKKLQATPACINPKHRQAKASVTEQKRQDGDRLREKVQGYVKRSAAGWGLPDARAIAIDRILAEAALWDLLSYRLPDWSVAHGGKRNTAWQTIHALPDAELAVELVTAIAGDFRDKAGYHVDWPALAAEFGIDDEALP